MSTPPPSNRGRLTWPVAAALTVLCLAHAARWWFVCDDAYISFRYARHLAEGHGLVFNLGESPPVEGYTNLLWTLWSALWQALHVAPEWPANLVSCAAAVTLVLSGAGLAARLGNLTALQTFAAGAVVAALPATGVWSSSGLETMACAAAVFGAAERLLAPERPRVLCAALWAAAACWLRADGFVFVGLALALALFLRPGIAGAAARTALAACAAVLLLFLVRRLVHGEWLPLTAKAKTGFEAWRFGRGALYGLSMLLAMPALVVLLAAPLLARAAGRRMALAGALALAGVLAWSVLVGGDFMAYGRFLAPCLGFLALAAGALAARATWAALSLAGLSLLPAFGVELAPQAARQALHFRWNEPDARSESEMWAGMRARAQEWLALGRALAPRTNAEQSIVLGAIGAVGWATELHVHDQYGLVSPEVLRAQLPPRRASPGHDRRVDAEFFLPQKPTYLGAWFARPGEDLDRRLPAEWLQMLAGGEALVERHALRADEAPFEGAELRLLRLSPR